MSDNKKLYSETSKLFIEASKADSSRYDSSIKRKDKYNKNWEKQKVNINEIIKKFAPDFKVKCNNEKIIFIGNRYNVIADMASGYLRIYDNKLRTHVKLDGTPGKDKETHFKIKKSCVKFSMKT